MEREKGFEKNRKGSGNRFIICIDLYALRVQCAGQA